jgi:hypothetical protein
MARNQSAAARRELLRDIESFTCGEVPSPLTLLRAPLIQGRVTAARR